MWGELEYISLFYSFKSCYIFLSSSWNTRLISQKKACEETVTMAMTTATPTITSTGEFYYYKHSCI